jgi:hypothetical protein
MFTPPVRLDYYFVEDANVKFIPNNPPGEKQEAFTIYTDAPGGDRADFHRRFHSDTIAFLRKQGTASRREFGPPAFNVRYR